MKRQTYKGLIALNAVLLAALMTITLAVPADAEQRARRSRGEYTMVAGRVQGVTESAIYVIDAANQEMLALRWNRSNKSLSAIGFRDLAADARRATSGGR